MTTIATVRDGIAKAITNGCGLRAVPYVSDNVAHPVAHVYRSEFDPRMVLGQAKAAYPFRVRVFVGRTAERAAQVRLDELCEVDGPTSLTAAVQDESNWPSGGLVDYAVVTNIGEVQLVTVAEEVLMAVDFDIEVVF